MTVEELRALLAPLEGNLIVYVGTGSEIAHAKSIDHDTFYMQEGPAIVIEGEEDS